MTSDQHFFVAKNYYETESVTDVKRKFETHFKNTSVSRKHIYKIVNKYEQSGSVDDAAKSGRPSSSRSEENTHAISDLLGNSPEKSVRRTSSETGISKSSVHNIIRKRLETVSIQNAEFNSHRPQGRNQDLFCITHAKGVHERRSGGEHESVPLS